jgi:hypothetical protein
MKRGLVVGRIAPKFPGTDPIRIVRKLPGLLAILGGSDFRNDVGRFFLAGLPLPVFPSFKFILKS